MVRALPGEQAAERGTTVIADRVVRRIASRAAEECLGKEGTTEDTATGVVRRGTSARLSVGVGLRYPADSAGLGCRVQDHVTSRTAELTGLQVHTADVTISALRPGPAPFRRQAAPKVLDAAQAGEPGTPGPAEARRRSWSARRLPAGLLALAATAAGAALLYDLATSRGRTAARLQDTVLDRLADAVAGGPWPVVAGAGVALLGAWLVALALTPGARRLPMAVPAPGVRARLARGSARALLRDAALDVPGVTAARVRLRRTHRVRVRVTVAFGEPDAARAVVSEQVGATLAALGTAPAKRLRITAVRDKNWRAPDVTEPAGQKPDEPDHHEETEQHETPAPHQAGA